MWPAYETEFETPRLGYSYFQDEVIDFLTFSKDHGSDCETSAFTTRPGGFPHSANLFKTIKLDTPSKHALNIILKLVGQTKVKNVIILMSLLLNAMMQ